MNITAKGARRIERIERVFIGKGENGTGKAMGPRRALVGIY
jgi:hypothetical protein